MKKPLLAVKDIVQITGITSRTLHYYDRIDLFKPTHLTEKGYRLYDRSSLEKLQTILFLKELDFSLKEIADILKLTRQEQNQILKKQRQTLFSRKQRLETIMVALEEYVSGNDISNLQIFNNSSVLPLKEQYANEARFIYGETEAYNVFNETLDKLSQDEIDERFQSMEEVFKQIASCVDQHPSSDEVQRLIKEWKKNLMQFMPCDKELLACIADTYKFDVRFNNYFNQYSNEDFADFLHSAIMHHISQS
ncbi:MerR family transcriptional regulator [Paenibacillus odorifer]|uniref:MerR family transcriptional regulator n=1 Tax=Paenibacillus odorifer TaxID=189426 RepID=A0A1R0X3E0_9BACL|nr:MULTISPECIES: MerR family transcriptional regulator [Paenibacillus]AIQ74631.1 MerR family transcriptional regulator [Paenibacillus odorifer]ETT67445.1 MerR family transcriptional regulator [Paenibacillus sp. FSL H8-237]OMC93907.1 MerR family transcriptional regulator [Paenibacillus odorifer]OMD27904.1 MerR family transcriptional regulator [Paenibacillus odorifer]OMD28564.1 MerR family transcriptional regulator [Paenibacillus odorifer]